jgi:YHS domain-containing protein
MKNICFALALSVSALVACGGNTPPANSAESAAAFKAPGEAKVGDKTKCPVSGEEFVVTAESPKVEVDGKTYYMCCAGCSGKFKADPKKFLSKT